MIKDGMIQPRVQRITPKGPESLMPTKVEELMEIDVYKRQNHNNAGYGDAEYNLACPGGRNREERNRNADSESFREPHRQSLYKMCIRDRFRVLLR